MIQVSVIIPAYNVEKYISYSLESALRQTAKEIEVIVVDDGSTDRTKEIVQSYLNDYACLRYFYKENGGLADARNFGVDQSKGKFIFFLDADDYIPDYALEVLLEIQSKTQATLISSMFEIVENYQATLMKSPDAANNYFITTPQHCLELMYRGEQATVSSWGKLIARELTIQHRFVKGIWYEDLEIITRYLQSVQEVVLVPEHLYFYYMRPGSITNSAFSEKQFDFFHVAQQNIQYVKETYPENKPLLQSAISKLILGGNYLFLKKLADAHNLGALKRVKKIYAPYFWTFTFDYKVPWKHKLRFLCFMISPTLYSYFGQPIVDWILKLRWGTE